MNLLNCSLEELAARIKKGEILPEELQEELIQGCKKSQEEFNVFISFDEDFVKRELHTLFQEKLQNGEKLNLAGASCAVADNIATKDLATTCASRMLQSYRPPFDAEVVARLKETGAIIAGKTNMEEFSIGSLGESSFFQSVKNPWNKNHTAGSGAAAAVLTGAARIAFASDARGELGQSAAYCGVLALRPTFGRISKKGLITYASSLETMGILARSAADLWTVFLAVAGQDPEDVMTLLLKPQEKFYLKESDAALPRLAVLSDWQKAPYLEDEVSELFSRQLQKLKALGAEIHYVDLPHFRFASIVAGIIAAVEAFSNLSNYDGVRFGYRAEGRHLQEMYLKTRSEGLSGKAKRFLTFGALLSSAQYYEDYFLKAQKLRTLIVEELTGCLQEYGALLTPATPFKAPKLDSFPGDALRREELLDPSGYFTAAAGLAGLPSLTFPLHTDGLPCGLQLIGKKEEELTLLKAALLLEKENQFAWGV